MLQDLQELQQQLLEAAKDKKEVTSHDLGRKWLQKVMQMVVYYKYHIWSGMVWYGMVCISLVYILSSAQSSFNIFWEDMISWFRFYSKYLVFFYI